MGRVEAAGPGQAEAAVSGWWLWFPLDLDLACVVVVLVVHFVAESRR